MEIINLDMTPSTVTPNAHAGQYDASRTVRFMLKNGGVPFTLAGTETITAEITRSDNTEVTVNVANTSSNYVDVVFDDTVCTVKGLYACELRLKDSDGFDIGSKNFALLVQRDPYDGAGVVVETVGPADICTFETTLPEPLQSVIVNIVATGGNGTPDNPNPIVGYTEANITANGNTYTIAFGQTVYGGVLDVTRGKLTVSWIKKPFADLVNVSGWNRTGTGVFYIYPLSNAFSNFKSPFTDNPKSTHFDYQTSGTLQDGCFRCSDALYFVKDNEPDIASMKTWFTNTDGFFTYELATPFDIDLTPEVISAIVGENNVFADCGQTTVKYLKAGE